MANDEQLTILRQGVDVWNEWRQKNRDVVINLNEVVLTNAKLIGVDLREAQLRGADLRGADLRGAHFAGACLIGAHFNESYLTTVDFTEAELMRAVLVGADLRGATLRKADLSGTDFSEADLSRADFSEASFGETIFSGANLTATNLKGADLTGTDLRGALLDRTHLQEANLSDCRIYGISVWGVNLKGAIQSNLIITSKNEPEITVDNLEVAQFIYLLIHNEKLRDVIDTISTKVVLILGRFTPRRKAVLKAIQEELRTRNYIPVLFDFEQPSNRDVTETVRLLANMARFVIADLTYPRSLPHELMSFVEGLPSVAVQPLILKGQDPYGMFGHFLRYPSVLRPHEYESQAQLIAELNEKVIEPAEAKVDELRPAK